MDLKGGFDDLRTNIYALLENLPLNPVGGNQRRNCEDHRQKRFQAFHLEVHLPDGILSSSFYSKLFFGVLQQEACDLVQKET